MVKCYFSVALKFHCKCTFVRTI